MVSILKLEATNKNRESCDGISENGRKSALLLYRSRHKGGNANNKRKEQGGAFCCKWTMVSTWALIFVCGCGCDGVVQNRSGDLR
jgi:hypothetical protein